MTPALASDLSAAQAQDGLASRKRDPGSVDRGG